MNGMNLSRPLSLLVFTTVLACTPPSSATDDATQSSSSSRSDDDAKSAEPKKKELKVSQNDLPAPPDVAAPPADAHKSSSGLASKVIKPGTGSVKPTADDAVEVHYTGWTKDGRMFDSSRKRNATAKFPLRNVIKGWTEGLQLMVEGEQRRFWIPADLAYGESPRGGRPAGQLTFDVELVKVIAVPKTPPDVAAVPKDAQKSSSGLAWKVVQKGTGTTKPKATDTVEVHYAGWTTDGKLFDSSYSRGETTSFPLNRVIKGWTEGVQQMVVGERTRFWIPAELAYGNNPGGGAPAGMLVFDIELVSIK